MHLITLVQPVYALIQHKLYLLAGLLILALAYWTHAYLTCPFRTQKIPGPFLGKFTNAYRWYHVMRHTWHRDLMDLHKKYGPIVWIAPDEVSVSDPTLRNVIYGFQNHKKDFTFFKKSPSYEAGSINQDFSFIFEQDPEKARLGKYHMSHFYSERGLFNLEENFDKAVEELIEGLDKHHARTGAPCKMVDWTEFFALDLVAQITADQSAGFCLAGKDINDTAYGARVIIRAVGVLTPMPWVLSVTSRAIRQNFLLRFLINLYRNLLLLPTFTFDTGMEDLKALKEKNPKHLLAKFYNAQSRMREHYPHGNQAEGTTIQIFNLIAGALGVVPHCQVRLIQELAAHPEVVQKIREELATTNNTLNFEDFLRYNNRQNKYPILESAVREAVRLTPAASFPLSRKVPPSGCQLHQYNIPPGYNVSMASYQVNYDEGYFGPDVAEFRPERWLGDHPTEMLDGEKRSMKNYLEAGWLTFGAGGRVCIGRNLAMFMMLKFTAALVREFDIQVVKQPVEYYTLMTEMLGMEALLTRRCAV
ncbi:cytochrome P450 [Choiromyces venosus 120613-1]|uniref:Cytochrome P450 n=1 Tax=Choiromyces venosus 120613-1 TaxID=1336337 RepID=A0A3N4JDJ5_9PEZI|nr:cytochrome P450 [Choiromyces venosus 120613-1]